MGIYNRKCRFWRARQCSRVMNFNSALFARVARRVHRGQSVLLPYINATPNKQRDDLPYYHFSHGIQSFPVKSLLLERDKLVCNDDDMDVTTTTKIPATNTYSGVSIEATTNSKEGQGYIVQGVSGYQSGVIQYTSNSCLETAPIMSAFAKHQRQYEIDLLPERDWNQEFNQVLECDPLERAAKLSELQTEFVAVAAKIGKLIISERNLPECDKQIKPIHASGIAGGEKFKVKGIFFKFALDTNRMYGSDENAMKVACHELKGHTALVSCGMMHGLKLGLMTVLDYQGYRLTATSVLPISDKTLVYGSSDGGNEVHCKLQVMNDLMQKCGHILNLKGHIAGVGPSPKFIYGPCDLEGHLGNDGRLYAVDLARMFPPETPNTKFFPGGFLFRLLRPELVRAFPKALSSDAFSGFGRDNAETHNNEVREATSFLHNTVIPNFASYLDSSSTPLSIEQILVHLHRNGINIRFLGEVRSHLTGHELRKMVLTEICTRVLKNESRRLMRKLSNAPADTFSKHCVNFLNSVFVRRDTINSVKFWIGIKQQVFKRFPGALSASELKPEFDLRKHIHMDLLLVRLQDLLGIELSTSDRSKFPLGPTDIKEFVVKTKHMYTVPRIEADTAAELARSCTNKDDAKSKLELARRKYYCVLELKPDDHVVLANLGMVLAELAVIETDIFQRNMLFAEANEKFESSFSLKNDDQTSLVMWADVMINQIIHTEEGAADSKLLHRAIELGLKAESIKEGSGSLIVARGCALQNREQLLMKWLRHANVTNNIPSPRTLLNDPAYSEYKSQPWFVSLLQQVEENHHMIL